MTAKSASADADWDRVSEIVAAAVKYRRQTARLTLRPPPQVTNTCDGGAIAAVALLLCVLISGFMAVFPVIEPYLVYCARRRYCRWWYRSRRFHWQRPAT